MEEIIFYAFTFLSIYLLYLFLIILRKKKRVKMLESTEVKYLKTKYKLNKKILERKAFPHVIALANSFIVATTVIISLLGSNFLIRFLIGFVVLIPLILLTYHGIGTYYRKKMK